MSARIAYIVKRFPRLSETFVVNEILEVRRQGVDVTVYALMDPHESVVSPEAEKLRAEIVYIHPTGHSLRSWRNLLAGAALQAMASPGGLGRVAWALLSVHRSWVSLRHAVEGLWLARDLRRRGITHLHAHFAHSPAAVAHMAHLGGGIPFSFTAHAKDLYTTRPRNIRIRAGAATFIVTCTGFNYSYLEELVAGGRHAPIHVIHHGTDLSLFRPDRRQPEPGRLLSVGRLVEKKGFPYLIEALNLLKLEGVDFSCDVYGGGGLRADLEARTATCGLGGLVRFHGPRQPAEIRAAFARAELFVLSPVVLADNDRDGIPNVLVEAMAAGLPVITTRVSGIPELIDDGVDGLLVEARDSAALAGAIARLLQDPELAQRLAYAARLKVERLFDLRRNTSHLVDLFIARPGAAGREAA